MSKTCDLAIVGATGLVGEAMVEFLAERKFPVGKLHLLATDRSVGKKLEFRDRYLPVEPLQGFDFSQVHIVLFAAGAEAALKYAPKAAKAGAVVIDTSGAFSADADVPLVVAEVNPDAISELPKRRIVASPRGGTVQLALALKPLLDAAGLERVSIASYQSVSSLGREAVEELATQTANLLNLREVKSKVFPRQMAFNLLPRVDAFSAGGYSLDELALVHETRRVLGLPELPLSPTSVRVPVFHGLGQAVHLETARKLGAGEARRLLEKAPGVKVLDDPGEDGYPTPVTEAAHEDEVFIGRIREDISHPRGLNFWTVADNVRKGAALNGVQIAERLVRDHF